MSKVQKTKPCVTGTEIQVRYCLVRRALAFDQANLMDFKLMEAWNEKLDAEQVGRSISGFC